MGDAWIGFLACAFSGLFFGTMFVPLKNFNTGDGLFIQFIMGCAILLVGVIINAIESFPTFYPLSMLGGFLWATGNITAVPIINCIGMAIGILLWSSSNMFFGWASGRFGWFGMKEEIPGSLWMNYIGVLIATIGGVIFVFVKSTPVKPERIGVDESSIVGGNSSVGGNSNHADEENDPLLLDSDHSPMIVDNVEKPIVSGAEKEFLSFIPTPVKRIVGIVVALIAGCFYGLCFAPIIYIQDQSGVNGSQYFGASERGLPYVFGQYMGIFVTCTCYFIVYCIVKRNRPVIRPETVIPAFLCGLMWAIAQASWFVANEKLQPAISFPVISRLPGVVAALWGVFYYREIKGRRNMIILCVAMVISIAGAILTGLSK